MFDQENLRVRNTAYILQEGDDYSDDQQADIMKGFDLKVMPRSAMQESSEVLYFSLLLIQNSLSCNSKQKAYK